MTLQAWPQEELRWVLGAGEGGGGGGRAAGVGIGGCAQLLLGLILQRVVDYLLEGGFHVSALLGRRLEERDAALGRAPLLGPLLCDLWAAMGGLVWAGRFDSSLVLPPAPDGVDDCSET